MVNNLNEKRNVAVIISAIVISMLLMVSGAITGLVLEIQRRHEMNAVGNGIARYLLSDAAYSLKSSMSALRLCVETEPAEELNRTALVHAVRAETALECGGDDWAENRKKEAFLNDIATVLHSYETRETIEMADMLYEYAARFYDVVTMGGEFEYDGELIKGSIEDDEHETTEEEIAEAKELISTALEADEATFIGAWGDHIEFNISRGDQSGYAVVCGGKISEFSFLRKENADDTDPESAKDIALATAEACGYNDLVVKYSERVGKSVAVVMCRSYDGALACDDLASAVIYGGETVAFSAGSCECEHKDIPKAKKSEAEARRQAVGGGDGVLVVHRLNGKERICYEYRYELDDGVHFVYVCAESGKQIEVK